MKFMWHSKSNKKKNSSPHIFIFPVWIYANFSYTQSSSEFQHRLNMCCNWERVSKSLCEREREREWRNKSKGNIRLLISAESLLRWKNKTNKFNFIEGIFMRKETFIDAIMLEIWAEHKKCIFGYAWNIFNIGNKFHFYWVLICWSYQAGTHYRPVILIFLSVL